MKTTDSIFRHSVRVNVRFTDIDLLGHVSNSSYCAMYDEGRVMYFKETAGEEFAWNKIGFVIANLKLDFFNPTFLFDKVEVTTRTSKIGNKSLILEQEIRLRPDGKLISKATSTMVAFDIKNQTSHPINQQWIDALEHFEQCKLKETSPK